MVTRKRMRIVNRGIFPLEHGRDIKWKLRKNEVEFEQKVKKDGKTVTEKTIVPIPGWAKKCRSGAVW